MGNQATIWRHRTGEIVLDRTRVMGILNVTPDSFSDGGRYFDAEAALRHGLDLVEMGADLVGEVRSFLTERIRILEGAGVASEAIAVDPGVGFGKTPDHNLALLRHLDQIAALGHPVVVGVSRKSFLERLGGGATGDRLSG